MTASPQTLETLSRGLTARTARDIERVLSGQRRGPGTALLFAGPAIIASIAYMDPGNYATNIQAGAAYGYALLWVVAVSSVVAMLFQALSAKLGIVTGRNLAETCRDQFRPSIVYVLWGVSEVAAMATDLAEFLGGAIGLSLLIHIPLLTGMGITALITFGILLMERHGFRPMELVIGAFVAAIGLCYVVELWVAPVHWAEAAWRTVIPSLPNTDALTVAVGIVGATVMPHAIYLHSGLTQSRTPSETQEQRRTLVRFSNREVVAALSAAGFVNMAMLITAAATFHVGYSDVADIGTAYRTLVPLLGAGAGAGFLISLLASGVSSSVVGTLAGQMIMRGFTGWTIPVWARRLVTMAPAFIVVALGVNATQALVLSQVVLSFALPIPVVSLVLFTRRRDIMGEFANSVVVDFAAIAAATIILALNLLLVMQLFGVPIPFMPPA